MNKQEKIELLRLISNNHIKEAIDRLLVMDITVVHKQETIAIAAQLQEFRNKSRRGILSNEQENLERNQIIDRLIKCINAQSDNASTHVVEKHQKSIWETKIVQLIGLIMSMIFILGLWWWMTSSDSNLPMQLTVFVTDVNGNVVLENEGELHTTIGHRTLHTVIGAAGRTNFGDILASYNGEPITIGLKAEGWEIIDGNNEFIFTGEPITLRVTKDNSLGIIKGIVKSRDGQAFIEGAVVRINSDTTVVTDELGFFKIILPHEMQVDDVNDNYLLTVSKDGYRTKTQYHYPKSSDAEIRLENQ